MNSRSLKRLRADHNDLYQQGLPPNYLFDSSSGHGDDLTKLDILLAGPTHTPFAQGVWKLHLDIPPDYPTAPPKANFRTIIFHPNVDPQTLGVCVETLKRDWDRNLTLRDVLVTISCLLIQPNPDSALNADAGALLQADYSEFSRTAEMMTSVHARIPDRLRSEVLEAQNRGQEAGSQGLVHEHEVQRVSAVPVRRRRTIAKVRNARRSEDQHSPTRQREQPVQRPATRGDLLFKSSEDDPFGPTPPQRQQTMFSIDEEGILDDAEQENGSVPPLLKQDTSKPAMTPKRPHGKAVPLGELILDQDTDEDTSEDMIAEYPPSPKKSPTKSAQKKRKAKYNYLHSNMQRHESSRNAEGREPNATPPNISDTPLAQDSPLLVDVTFDESLSPRKVGRGLFHASPKRSKGCFGIDTLQRGRDSGISASESIRYTEKHGREQGGRDGMHAKLWELCGHDIRRWNHGDFDGQNFRRAAGRW